MLTIGTISSTAVFGENIICNGTANCIGTPGSDNLLGDGSGNNIFGDAAAGSGPIGAADKIASGGGAVAFALSVVMTKLMQGLEMMLSIQGLVMTRF